MAESELQQDINSLDEGYGITMAYLGRLVENPASVERDANSAIATHMRKFGESEQHLNPAYLAWRSIASAGEHAGIAEHLRFVTGGGILDRPQASLARATLLGAARAIFVLQPDSARERISRAAKLANNEVKDARRMLDAWSDRTAMVPGLLDSLDKHTSELAESAGRILVREGLKERTSVNESDMFRVVAPQLPGDPDQSVTRVFELWNRASGVAHARSWTWNTPYGIDHQFDFIDTWSVPVELLVEAWKLWNLRRGIDNPSPEPPIGWEPDRDHWGSYPRNDRE
ncbi:hypothetical protein [Brevibacterium gallinarum]|uniref:DUF222 domain-containing protein n=1 Tax=Brevibacterium gallinarum TaxID=2762220 RepID=A0ABR8WWL7_9MICO|nr:hypothetical protein [Brevibacterium gallinarum]MBD8021006.1 hypothetical protein [Brevibacterium gallinarum]